jgi:hypothetical protein
MPGPVRDPAAKLLAHRREADDPMEKPGGEVRTTSEESRCSEKAGLSPGTLMYVGDKKIEKPRVTVID